MQVDIYFVIWLCNSHGIEKDDIFVQLNLKIDNVCFYPVLLSFLYKKNNLKFPVFSFIEHSKDFTNWKYF